MSERSVALNALDRKIFRAFKVYEQGLRAEIYDVLERNQIGRGRHWPGNPNPSSRPGDPPAKQSGNLKESIAIIKAATPTDLRSEVGPRPQAYVKTGFNYGAWLEYGGRYVAPRPFMRPGVKNFLQKFRKVRVG